MSPKIVFCLTHLGRTSDDIVSIRFEVKLVDQRFLGHTFNASNGWRVRADQGRVYMDIDCRVISVSSRPGRASAHVCQTLDSPTTDASLMEIVEALREWSQRCPFVAEPIIPLPSVSSEVRESLLNLEEPDEDEDPDNDGPAPIYVEHFEGELICL